MSTLTYHGFGRTTLEDVPTPSPNRHETVVDIRFAGVNPLDVRICRGVMDRGLTLPFVPGTEGSGITDGRPALVYGSGVGTARDGTFRSTAMVPENAVHYLPEGFDLVQGAVLGTAAVTAWSIVNSVAEVDENDSVLILGAAGGVGVVAVQLAIAAGADVWAQTSQAAKAERLEAMGAVPVLADSPDGLAGALGTLRPNIIFDPLGGDYTGAAVRSLHPSGEIVVYGTCAGAEGRIDLRAVYRNRSRIIGYASMMESRAHVGRAVTALVEMIERGTLMIPIHEVIPIDCAEDAFAELEARKVFGKVVLQLR